MLQENIQEFQDALREWNAKGWRAIPCVVYWSVDKDGNQKRDKVPLVNWKIYQARNPTPEEVESWCKNSWRRFAGIEVITGNGVVCVDFDQKDGHPDLDRYNEAIAGAMFTITGGGGLHAYFSSQSFTKNHTNIFAGNKTNGDTIVDIRGDGGVAVVGPTPTWDSDPRGNQAAKQKSVYKTHAIIDKYDLPAIPEIFLAGVRKSGEEKKYLKILKGAMISEGTRHDIAASFIGRLVSEARELEDLPSLKEKFKSVMAAQFQGEFPDEEWETMFNDFVAKETKNTHSKLGQRFNSLLSKKTKDERKERHFSEDMEEWADIKITKVEQVNDILVFKLADGIEAKMKIDDVLVQKKFRTAIFAATRKLPGAIRPDSYEQFIGSFEIEKISNMGITKEERCREIIMAKSQDSFVCDNEIDALKRLERHPSTIFGCKFYFKVSLLQNERVFYGVDNSSIASALRSIGAVNNKSRTFNYWTYDIE